MKKQIMVLVAFSAALPLFAQETNTHQNAFRPGEKPPWEHRDPSKQKKRSEWSREKKAEHAERRLQLMDRALDRIGVSAEERAEILKLQEQHRKIMKSNERTLDAARRKLSELQDSMAAEAELDAAINAVIDAQSAHLKTLVANRREMERILGKEKFDRFMEAARSQFRKHGRHGGPGMPQRPKMGEGPREPDTAVPATP